MLRDGALMLGAGVWPPQGLRAQAPSPKRILFLGGTGFIGPHLVHAALDRGHRVSMLNRGRRAPNQHADDFAKVEALRGDRSQPDAYASLAGRTWDVVVDTANSVPWTRAAVAALTGAVRQYVYVSSTGVFWPYRTVEIPEDGPVVLEDTPPRTPPSFGVMKAQSERAVREGMPGRALVIRPGYIVGPGDTSDRFTYWPVRMARGGEVLVPGRRDDRVQYIDVRDLAAWMVRLMEQGAAGTFNAVGPASPQTLAQFIDGLRPLAPSGTSFSWIEDYAFLSAYPLRAPSADDPGGLIEAIPWVMAAGDELGHMRISHRKAVAAGLTYRPLIDTARDTLAWRQSDAVPEALRTTPRYVLTAEQERAVLAAWRARAAAGRV
ncbi:MAG: NAD-dependent epimerase/dehydratase family protein [Acidobacteria bacterium]|nr:NAD-dependent epimerase/dehydratase family protein [Acidobacteriota bacterium]